MIQNNLPQIELLTDDKLTKEELDLQKVIYDLDAQIDMLSVHADNVDYLVATASGVLCAMLDIFWVGEFDLGRGRELASEQVDDFVTKVANLTGYKGDDIGGAVEHLEKLAPLASDGNTPDFGGGLQHHLRDFAHHPTIVGLFFSLLTQFTKMSYGTTKEGAFRVVPVPEKSLKYIGDNFVEQVVYGSLGWFFHLVSDMAGSGSTAGKGGGTGIPGPILSLAKELSSLPLFHIKDGNSDLSVFLSKLFNGTAFAHRDEKGKIIPESVIKFDLRGEMGLAAEVGRQAVPVIANECILRVFYFIRRFISELRRVWPKTMKDIKRIDWQNVKPVSNPTLARMLTISSGVFSTLDIGEAILTQKYWVSVNYIGVGRFAVALGEDISWGLKLRNVKAIKEMYAHMQYTAAIENKLGLSLEQTEILYNLEYQIVRQDAFATKGIEATVHKLNWLQEWTDYMEKGYVAFTGAVGAELHWYTEDELKKRIREQDPLQRWFKQVLLETIIFKPYFPVGTALDKDGKQIPDERYRDLYKTGINRTVRDRYLEQTYSLPYCGKGYIKRLVKAYEGAKNAVKGDLKKTIKAAVVVGGSVVLAALSMGTMAPSIAVYLVGSSFAGLHGAALTSACLAYLGGGAIAAGGMGMAGGTVAIIGGGAVLGLGVGAGADVAIVKTEIVASDTVITDSAKLLTNVSEIFLASENDTDCVRDTIERYTDRLLEEKQRLSKWKLEIDMVEESQKKALRGRVKEQEAIVEVMTNARKSIIDCLESYEKKMSK